MPTHYSKRHQDPVRTADMVERSLAGETAASIARDYGISRERVRQIIAALGVTGAMAQAVRQGKREASALRTRQQRQGEVAARRRQREEQAVAALRAFHEAHGRVPYAAEVGFKVGASCLPELIVVRRYVVARNHRRHGAHDGWRALLQLAGLAPRSRGSRGWRAGSWTGGDLFPDDRNASPEAGASPSGEPTVPESGEPLVAAE